MKSLTLLFAALVASVAVPVFADQRIVCGFDSPAQGRGFEFASIKRQDESIEIQLSRALRNTAVPAFMHDLLTYVGDTHEYYVLRIDIAHPTKFTYSQSNPLLSYIFESKGAVVKVLSTTGELLNTIKAQQVLLFTKDVFEDVAQDGKTVRTHSQQVHTVIDVLGTDGFTKRFTDVLEFFPNTHTGCRIQ